MTTQPTEQDVQDALQLLGEAHRRLLDDNNYTADFLIYRAMQFLSGSKHTGAGSRENFRMMATTEKTAIKRAC